MMNESPIVFCREWAVTAALVSYLTPAYSCQINEVYSQESLRGALQKLPLAPVVLGMCPHEHVLDLYRLQPLLAGRPILFVGRHFYWTDYKLPEWLGLDDCGFGTWDTMQEPFSRRMELRFFRQTRVDTQKMGNVVRKGQESAMTDMQILENANRWLYRELSVSGLTGYEVRVLSLLSDGHKGNLPARARSLHKNNGLNKLGMSKLLMNLYRGVKVRAALQTCLPSQVEDGQENCKQLRQGTGW